MGTSRHVRRIMKKTTIKHILEADAPLSPYCRKLKFIVTDSLLNAVAAELGLNTDFDDDDEAFASSGPTCHIVIRRKHLTYGNVAHEVQHVVDDLFQAIGHAPEDGTDEAKSYMAGYIHSFIYRSIDKSHLWLEHDAE